MPRKPREDWYEPQDFPVTGEAKDSIWLRWETEPEEDYAHFQAYRDLPPTRRTMENAVIVYTGGAYAGEAREPGKREVPASWKGQARKWRWKERASKFDIWKEKSQLEAERDGTLQAWKEMGERHAREAMLLQQKALERLQRMNPAELSASEVRQFLVQAATLERLARGASLQDMARVQREKEAEAAQQGYAVITYVDDWRGDHARQKRRNPDSFYGNGQGVLPDNDALRRSVRGVPELESLSIHPPTAAQRSTETFFPGRAGEAELSVPAAPSGAAGSAEAAAPVHLPRRRKKVAQDDHGHDPGRGSSDPG